MSNQESPGGVSRRALLKSTALGSLALAAGGLPARAFDSPAHQSSGSP